MEERKLDYLIGSVHYFLYKGEWQHIYKNNLSKKELSVYTQYVISSIESKLFAFIAHPDLFANSYHAWDEEAIAVSKDIFSAAENYKVPLELNSYGFRKAPIITKDGTRPAYPIDNFWKLAAEYKIDVIINSDAHRPQDVIGAMDQGFSLAKKYNLSVIELNLL